MVFIKSLNKHTKGRPLYKYAIGDNNIIVIKAVKTLLVFFKYPFTNNIIDIVIEKSFTIDPKYHTPI